MVMTASSGGSCKGIREQEIYLLSSTHYCFHIFYRYHLLYEKRAKSKEIIKIGQAVKINKEPITNRSADKNLLKERKGNFYFKTKIHNGVVSDMNSNHTKYNSLVIVVTQKEHGASIHQEYLLAAFVR